MNAELARLNKELTEAKLNVNNCLNRLELEVNENTQALSVLAIHRLELAEQAILNYLLTK